MPRKKVLGDHHHYGFRMPTRHYDLLLEVAEARGIDLAAVMNSLVADAAPKLQEWLDAYRAAMPPTKHKDDV